MKRGKLGVLLLIVLVAVATSVTGAYASSIAQGGHPMPKVTFAAQGGHPMPKVTFVAQGTHPAPKVTFVAQGTHPAPKVA